MPIAKRFRAPSPSQRPYLYRGHEEIQEPAVSAEPTTLDSYPVARRACRWGGLALVIAGAAGFAMPGFLGAHLSLVHNLIHLISGAVLVAVGAKARPSTVRATSLIFGSLYGLLGTMGFVLGQPLVSSIAHISYDSFLWVIMPGQLELGQSDHMIHLLIGAAYLFAGMRSARSIFASRMSFD